MTLFQPVPATHFIQLNLPYCFALVSERGSHQPDKSGLLFGFLFRLPTDPIGNCCSLLLWHLFASLMFYSAMSTLPLNMAGVALPDLRTEGLEKEWGSWD